MLFLKIPKVTRLPLLTFLALSVLHLQCTAILNTGGNNIRVGPNNAAATTICESKVCKCKPQLIACDCGSTTQGEELAFEGSNKLHDVDVLRVQNCRQVRIPASTLRNLTTLHRVELSNIGRIIVEPHGFSWKQNESSFLEANPAYVDNTIGSIIVKIENSVIAHIPSFAFQGRLEAVIFNGVQIGTVAPFAFSNLFRAERLEFTDTNFTNLESQAFKKFSVETVKFSGGNYGSLPSRTMVDLEVKSLVIENVAFNRIVSSAFIIKGPETFRMNGCRFTRVEGDAFRVVTNGPVGIRENAFVSLGAGAFAGITVGKHFFNTYGAQQLVFERNNVTHFENGSLVFNTSRLAPRLDRLFVEQPCSCNSIKLWAEQLIVYPPYSPLRKKQLADNSHRDSTLVSCRHDEKGKIKTQYIAFRDYNRINCGAVGSGTHVLLIVIIVGSSVLLLALGAVVILCVCRRRRARWINVPTSNKYEESPKKSKEKDRSPDGRITMVVPDGRVYRETEFHVIVEQAEPLTTSPEEHIYQNLKPKPLPRNIKQPVPQLRTDL